MVSSGTFSMVLSMKPRTVGRSAPRTPEYPFFFPGAAAEKSGKYSADNTSLCGIHSLGPFAAGPGWSLLRREHPPAWYACCLPAQTRAPGAHATALAAVPAVYLQFHRGTKCHDPPAQSG